MNLKSKPRYALLFFAILLVTLIPVALNFDKIMAALGGSDATPVAHWTFDEGSDNTCTGGTNDVCDSVGNSDAAALQSNWRTGSDCVSDGCLFFDGSASKLSIADNATLSITGDFTLGGWIKPMNNNTGSEYTIAGRWVASLEEYLLTQAGDEIRLWMGGSNYETTDNANLQIGTWYHVAASYDASAQTVKLYVNGIEQASTTTGTIPASITDQNNTFVFADSILASGTEYQVGANTDDAYDEADLSTIDDGNYVLLGGVDNADNNITAGFRFTNVLIAQGATIASAELDFNEDWGGNYSTQTQVKIYGEDADDCATFSNGSKPRDRTKTTAALDWDSNGSQGSIGQWYQDAAAVPPPNISTIIQEIVDRPGWSSGNDLCIVMDDDGSTTDWYMVGESYNDAPSEAAKLTIAVTGSGLNSNYFQGFMDEFKLFDSVLTENQLKAEAAGGAAILGANIQDPFIKDLVGYWNFDDKSGNATDQSGSNNTLTNVSSTVYSGGKFGTAAEPDGTADYFDVGDTTNLSLTGDVTLAAWINPDDVTSHSGHILGKWDGANESYQLIKVDDEIRMYIDSSSNYQTTDAANLAIDTWYHVAGVYDASEQTIKLYVNGVEQVSTTTGTIPASIGDDAGEFTIGAEDSGGTPTNFFDGHIDEARVYKRALPAGDIAKLYNWAPGPIGYWKLDEGTGGNGATVYDSSGYGYNGTINATASTWITGKFGKGLNLPGNEDSNGSEYIEFGDANDHFDFGGTSGNSDFTVMGWVDFVNDPYFGNDARVFSKYNCCGGTGWHFSINSSDYLTFYLSDGTDSYSVTGGTQLTKGGGNWVHVAAVFDADDANGVKIYLNGVNDTNSTSGTFANVGNINSTDTFQLNNRFYSQNVSVDDVKIYNYARTQQQIIEDMNGRGELSGNGAVTPVVYLPLDGGAGSGPSDYNAIVGSPITTVTVGDHWLPAERCVRNLCNDPSDGAEEISITNSDPIDLNVGLSSGFTWSFWMYTESSDSPTGGHLIRKGPSVTAVTDLYTNNASGGFADLVGSLGLASSDATVTASGALPLDDAWHHIAMSWTNDDDDEITIWVDAVPVATSTNGSGDPDADTADFEMCPADTENCGFEFDEIRIYASELTQEQMLIDYNLGSSTDFGSTANEYQQSSGSSTDSPVYYLDLNENLSGNGQNLYDKGHDIDLSGASFDHFAVTNDGANNTGMDCTVKGKYSFACDFDGTDDRLDQTDSSGYINYGGTSDSYTLSLWFNADTISNGDKLIQRGRSGWGNSNSAYTLEFDSSDQVNFFIHDGTNTPTVTSAAVSTGTWNHVVAVRNVSADELQLYVNGVRTTTTDTTTSSVTPDNSTGITIASLTGGGSYYDGKIDDVKMWNYALTPAQAAYEYNRGAPIAWYKFDEGSENNCPGGEDACDASGNGNHGTMGGVTSYSIGKINGAIDFNGDNGEVDIPDVDLLRLTTNFTVTAWINCDDCTTGDGAIFVSGGTGNNYWWVGNENDGTLQFNIDGGSTYYSTGTLTESTWHHVAYVKDGDSGTNFSFYIDGKPAGTASVGSLTTPAGDIAIGYRTETSATEFDGRIDDVRIYNYALSQAQIQKVMQGGKAGSSVRFGP